MRGNITVDRQKHEQPRHFTAAVFGARWVHWAAPWSGVLCVLWCLWLFEARTTVQVALRARRGGHCGALPGGASCSISVLMVRMALELQTGRAARLSSAKAYQPTNADGAHTSSRARCGRWVGPKRTR
jgi:hypothetical protein